MKKYFIKASEMPKIDMATKKWLYENTDIGKRSKDYKDFTARLWNKLYIRKDGELYIRDLKFANEILKSQIANKHITKEIEEFKELIKKLKHTEEEIPQTVDLNTSNDMMQIEEDNNNETSDYNEGDNVWTPTPF